MQHDVEQGRIPELDAIAGPVLRSGREHGLATPAIKDPVGQVRVNRPGVSGDFLVCDSSGRWGLVVNVVGRFGFDRCEVVEGEWSVVVEPGSTVRP